jgi:hypothetical protein
MGASFARAAEIAAVQHGRITTQQLRDCEISARSIERAVETGRLHRVHKGVYALGHLAPSREADWHAAVLAGGDGAVLSYRCAATALGIRDGVGPRIDVTIPSGSHRHRPGIFFHRADLAPFEIMTWKGVPITSPARTMVDLACHLRPDEEQVEWALRQLQYRRLFDPKLLELSLHRRPNRVLTQLLQGIEPTRSPLEIAFLHRVVHRHGLPVPQTNVRPVSFTVDFYWPEARLIVETDGRQHDDPGQRAADAVRDELHAAAGLLTLRYRWADVHRHGQTAAEILRHWRIRHL